jgi:2-polyprenyl-3-methyl-5-hydroxy-6-metoxy-1,4-benzoquinol methylase
MDGGCDHAYAVSSCVWGSQPGSFTRAFADQVEITGWQVLDAGCGEGRNAAFLAQRGALVWAVDVSSLALANAARLWADLEGIRWELADIRDIRGYDGYYDLVVADGLLHWLADYEDVEQVVGQLQALTRPGGLNVICAFNDRRQELARHAAPPRCILSHDQYLDLYRHWTIRSGEDSTSVSSHPGTPGPHAHSVTKLLAQAPAGPG